MKKNLLFTLAAAPLCAMNIDELTAISARNLVGVSHSFAHEQLMQHTAADRASLRAQILGHLAILYNNTDSAKQSRAMGLLRLVQKDAVAHTVTAVPARTGTIPLKLIVSVQSYSGNTQLTDFHIGLLDPSYYPVANCTVKASLNGARHATAGSLYWNMPATYTNPISAPVLLALRDTILTVLGVSSYNLTDKSWDVTIARNFGSPDNDRLLLRILGAYMHGQTYYQAKAGFKPAGTPALVTAYHDAQQLLYHLPFETLRQDFPNMPQIKRLQELFPCETRFGAIVLALYQGARNNNQEYYGLLEWVNKHCLLKYPSNSPEQRNIRHAQVLVKSTKLFYKEYPI